MISKSGFGLWLVLNLPWLAPAAVIGMNPPPQRLTADRIETAPVEQQPAWEKYLKSSTRELRLDKYLVQVEMKRANVKDYHDPPSVKAMTGISLREPSAWYGQAEARRLAEVIASFQTPAGGWGKER